MLLGTAEEKPSGQTTRRWRRKRPNCKETNANANCAKLLQKNELVTILPSPRILFNASSAYQQPVNPFKSHSICCHVCFARSDIACSTCLTWMSKHSLKFDVMHFTSPREEAKGEERSNHCHGDTVCHSSLDDGGACDGKKKKTLSSVLGKFSMQLLIKKLSVHEAVMR